jgi:hypothetical protein
VPPLRERTYDRCRRRRTVTVARRLGLRRTDGQVYDAHVDTFYSVLWNAIVGAGRLKYESEVTGGPRTAHPYWKCENGASPAPLEQVDAASGDPAAATVPV